MRITSWNIRGCCNALKIHLLRRRIEKEKYGIVFLQETKCSEEELKSIAEKIWKGCEMVAIDSKGATRRIGILWIPREVNLSGFVATPFSLSIDFHILGTRIRGFFTNIYGPPREEQKLSFLDSLTFIKKTSEDKPWILRRDFNLIKNIEEKKGDIWNLNHASVHFNDLIETLDLRTSNGIFTWNNK